MKQTRLLTLLDLHDPSRDTPWRPRGTSLVVHNGIRQRLPKGWHL